MSQVTSWEELLAWVKEVGLSPQEVQAAVRKAREVILRKEANGYPGFSESHASGIGAGVKPSRQLSFPFIGAGAER